MIARVASLVVAVAALLPASAQASITIGSDLTLPTTAALSQCSFTSGPCTLLGFGVHPGNQFPAKSPTKGIVTGFALKTSAVSRAGDVVRFRLGRFASSAPGPATGAGIGPSVTVTNAGVYTSPANLNISAGDVVGIDVFTATGAFVGYESGTCSLGTGFNQYELLSEGGSFQEVAGNSTCELLVQATIQPSSVFGFNPKQVYTVKKKGKIILPIELPGPGDIKVSGKGLARQGGASKAGAVTRTVSEAGTVNLPLKLARKKLRKLAAKGKGGLKLTITFTPVGGDPGTQTLKLKLKAR